MRAHTSDAPDTTRLGAALSHVLVPGDVVVLCGELGVGKTTFVQGVAAGLGVQEIVTSPTFTLLRPYACGPAAAPVRTMWHADLYRLGRVQEVEELGIGELVEDDAVALVEWGDVAGDVFGRQRVEVRIGRVAHADDSERDLTVELPPWSDPTRRDQLAELLRPWRRADSARRVSP